jgi:hypothetical protein
MVLLCHVRKDVFYLQVFCNFNPANTIIDVKTSEVDSIASAINAYEFPNTPAML